MCKRRNFNLAAYAYLPVCDESKSVMNATRELPICDLQMTLLDVERMWKRGSVVVLDMDVKKSLHIGARLFDFLIFLKSWRSCL